MTQRTFDESRVRRRRDGKFAGYDAAAQTGRLDDADNDFAAGDGAAPGQEAEAGPFGIRADAAGVLGCEALAEEALMEVDRVGRDSDEARQILGELRYVLECEDPQELARVEHDSDWHLIRRCVALHPGTPPETLYGLATDRSELIKLEVARNPGANDETLAFLARTGTEEIKEGVAGNPSAPPDTLEELARDGYYMIRRAAAGNPATPPDALADRTGWQREDDQPTLLAIAGNPSAPPAALDHLAHQDDPEIQQATARNPAAPRDAITHLAGSGNIGVRALAARHPNATHRVLEELSRMRPEIRLGVASNPKTKPAILERLCYTTDPEILAAVAANPRTSPDTLSSVGGHPSRDDRTSVAVARNPQTPVDRLARMAGSKELGLLGERESSPVVREAAIEALAQRDSDEARDILERIAVTDTPAGRAARQALNG